MNFLTFGVLAFLAIDIGIVNGQPTAEETYFTPTARFLKIDPMGGEIRGLHKLEIQSLARNENHNLRLDFGNNSTPLDMRVVQDSVWGSNSIVVVHRGTQRLTVPHAVNGNCYLYGRLINADGVVSINRCGKMTASVHTPDYHYKVEEKETTRSEESQAHTLFKVTRRNQEKIRAFDDQYLEEAKSMVEEKAKNILSEEEEHQIGNARVKRSSTPKVMIEVVVYIDKNFLDYLNYEKDLDTRNKVTDWMVTKWNSIQSIFSDPEEIGARVKIALKSVQFWSNNPIGYPRDDVKASNRLSWFCRNTPETDNYDMKALYTRGTGGQELGLGYVNTACRNGNKCFLVKSPTESIRRDVHELGHVIGFRHDPDIGFCDPIGGFMGWGNTYRYLPCYRTVLRRKLKNKRFPCFFQENVTDEPVLTS